MLELAWLNSHFESGLKSPMDDAILQHTEFTGEGWSKLDETPFDFERRRVAVLVAEAEAIRSWWSRGALEDVLRLSRDYEGDSPADLKPLDAAARDRDARPVRGTGPRRVPGARGRLEANAGGTGHAREPRPMSAT